jgi:outer membrane receptor protein involved in Fe transport
MLVSRKIWRRFVQSVMAGSIAVGASAISASVVQEPAAQPGAAQPEKKAENGQAQAGETAAGQPPTPMGAEPMPVPTESPLAGELGSGQSRAEDAAGPATFVNAGAQAAPAIETTELARESTTAGSISGVRRSPVAIQPVVRGYQQQSIYGQYNGAQYTPVRFDLDSILSNIDPGIIDNLIIIPGPYGVKYGPGLSFIDVVPTATPRYDCPEIHGRTDLLYQTQGEQFYGRQTIFGGASDYGYRVSYGHKVGSDYESGDDTDIPATYNVRDLDIAFGWDLNECAKIDIEYLRQDLTDTEYAGLVFDAEFRKTDAFMLRYAYDDGCAEKLLVEGWYNRTVFEGNNLNTSKQRFYQDNRFFDNGGGFPVVSFVGFTDSDVHNTGFRFVPTWGTEEGPQLTAGIDFHYTKQELHEFDDFNAHIPPLVLAPFPIPRSYMADTGVFAELAVPVECDLKVTTGGRLDWIHANADGSEPTSGGDTVRDVLGNDLRQNELLYAYFIAADYKLDECRDLRLGFGHSQRPASLTERYAIIPFLTFYQEADQIPFGDPDLDPEKAWQMDASITGKYECFRYRVGGFYAWIDDYITLTPDLPSGDSGNFVNADSTIAGFEMSGDYDLSPCWNAFATAAYLDGRNHDRNEPLPSIYPFQSRIGLRWHEPEKNRYGVEISARIVDDQDDVATSLGEQQTAGFTVYDLRSYWQMCEHVRFTAGIENFTDKNYLDHLSVRDPRVLEPGINFYLSMSITY